MELAEIVRKIDKRISGKLPGLEAQLKMSPPFRGKNTEEIIKNSNPRPSAVLILLYEKNNQAHVVFIERQKDNKAHSGQIAFPGGKTEERDKDFYATALREAEEEVGANSNNVSILGQLSWLYVPVSNFIIFPVIGYCKENICFVPQPSEVQRVIEVPFKDLLNEKNVIEKKISKENPKFEMIVPAYKVGGVEIWGATAMILSEFLSFFD